MADPVPHVIEALFLSAIVCKDYPHSALVVGLSYRAESLLAGCIPDLEFHILAVDLDRLDFEIDSYKEKLVN